MATDKPKISAYISPELFEQVTTFQTEEKVSTSEAISRLLVIAFKAIELGEVEIPHFNLQSSLSQEIKERIAAEVTFQLDAIQSKLDFQLLPIEADIEEMQEDILQIKARFNLLHAFSQLSKPRCEPPSNPPSEPPSNPPSVSPQESESELPILKYLASLHRNDTPDESPSDAPSEPPSNLPSDTPDESPSDAPSEPPSNLPSDTLDPKVFTLTQSQLADRLKTNASTLSKNRSKRTFSDWSKAKDPEQIAWKYHSKSRVYHPV